MGSFVLVVGGARPAREAAIAERVRAAGGGAAIRETRPSAWPFMRHAGEGVPPGGAVLVARNFHEAFPAGQTSGTRLVLTQSAWQVQRWLDWLGRRGDVTLIAEASATALREAAPEAFDGRGPWSRVERIEIPGADVSDRAEPADRSSLAAAFVTPDPAERLALCRRVVDAAPDDPVALTALASACMEVQDLDAAQTALEAAVAAAPDWEVPHYEFGKLWLRRDDMTRASEAFAEAGRLMPSFSASFSNLGATLGELGRSEEALAAFRHALTFDPNGYTILNNIGVVLRELGRLAESEAAFRKVIALAPEFVFGHYNLGHTLFLQGRYQAALTAYDEGQRRDPQKNARQACRLAVVRLAAGDAEGSLRDLRRFTPALPPDQKREALAEAQEILWALLSTQPGMAGWREVADVVKAELEALG